MKNVSKEEFLSEICERDTMSSKLSGEGFFKGFLRKPKQNNGFFDILAAVLVALTPVLQHYKGVAENLGFTALLVCVPIVCVRLLQFKWKWKALLPVLCLLAFEVLKIFTSGVSAISVGRAGLICLFYIALATGSLNKYYLILTGISFSAIAALGLAVQTVSFYFFGKHIVMIPVSFLLESAEQWIPLATTGLTSVSGMPTDFYRPSSLFLEPSHFFLYAFPAVIIFLFSKGRDRRKVVLAALISVGLLLSTSGMGLALVFGAWAFRFCFLGEDDELHFGTPFASWEAFGKSALKIVILAAVLFAFPFVRDAAARIIVPGYTGTNAIEGRSHSWALLRQISLSDCWFGFLSSAGALEEQVSFNAFVLTLALHGIIALVLSYIFYIRSAIVLKRPYRFIAIIVLAISVFTVHTHGTFFMLYYTAVLLQGYDEKELSAST